jgi:RNA polymerase sigma-70 factor (ECF subfamily)
MNDAHTDIGEADRDAVRRVRAGDVDAFALLVRRHEPRVRALCASMLNESGDADDAAQEAFLKAYRHLADFRGDALFSTWMHRIAYRHCLDLQKARRRRPSELPATPN